MGYFVGGPCHRVSSPNTEPSPAPKSLALAHVELTDSQKAVFNGGGAWGEMAVKTCSNRQLVTVVTGKKREQSFITHES